MKRSTFLALLGPGGPVAAGGPVLHSGWNRPLTAVAVERQGDRLAPREAWSNRTHSLYMGTPVVQGGRVFGFSHRQQGHLFCADLKTGATVWQSEGRLGDNAALLLAGDEVLVLTAGGSLLVLPTGPERFTVTARYQVGDGPTWAHPALAGGRIWVKDPKHLYCLTWRQ